MRALIAAAIVSFVAAACAPNDVGVCCQAGAGADPSIVPEPAYDSTGAPANVVSRDPQLLCEEISCVSYQGSKAYCTQGCQSDSGCPGDFKCVQVIASDPGQAATAGPLRYCVKQDHACE